MKVAVVGYGVEGRSAARYWQHQGDTVTICDADPQCRVELPDVATQLGGDYLQGLDAFDLIVRSPGVAPRLITAAAPSVAVTSVTNEFMARCPARIIGITGTKGKGTTASLIAKMFEADGQRVWLGGNIGTPALDFLDEVSPDDRVVLELSSFQLMDAKRSPHIAVCLMVVPDHLNYHADMTEYAEAKAQIFRYQQATDIAVYNAQNEYSRAMGQRSAGVKRPYLNPTGAYVKDNAVWYQDQRLIATSEVGIFGAYNLENVCAAVTASWGLVSTSAMKRAITEFKGLPHRLQLVGEVEGVRYYDDSLATTPETTMADIAAFKEPKVLIIGGSDKGASYGALAQAIATAKVRGVVVIGEVAPAIQAHLSQANFTAVVTGLTDMPAMVAAARRFAKPGDVVLLAPGAASFGLFRDYQDRGNQFIAAVKELEAPRG